jgi:branched-chain amino acid transport system ATP-binding protein
MTFLELDAVDTGYGRGTVLHGVSLKVDDGEDDGEFVSVLGANGAGKTSLLRLISRVLPVSGGTMRLAGRDASSLKPDRVVRMGVTHVPEGRQIFPELTVFENMVVAGFTVSSSRERKARIDEALDRFFLLRERRTQLGGLLSGGEQQMLAVARALVVRPRLLLLDEPSLGLAPLIVKDVMDTVLDLHREQGTSILLVEQNASVALTVSDRALLLETGRVVMEGSAEDMRQSEEVIRAYIGI